MDRRLSDAMEHEILLAHLTNCERSLCPSGRRGFNHSIRGKKDFIKTKLNIIVWLSQI